MENGGNRSHDSGEDLRSRGVAKTQSSELVHLAMCHKAKEGARFRMYKNLEVSLPEINGGHPVSLTNRQEGRLDGLHLKSDTSTKRLRVERSMTGLHTTNRRL